MRIRNENRSRRWCRYRPRTVISTGRASAQPATISPGTCPSPRAASRQAFHSTSTVISTADRDAPERRDPSFFTRRARPRCRLSLSRSEGDQATTLYFTSTVRHARSSWFSSSRGCRPDALALIRTKRHQSTRRRRDEELHRRCDRAEDEKLGLDRLGKPICCRPNV